MKKNCFAKHKNRSRSISACIMFICIIFMFSSCSKQIYSKKYQGLKDFAFQNLLYNKKIQCNLKNPQKFYYSPALNSFFLRHQIDSKGIRYLIEINNPEYTGILDASKFYSLYVDDGTWIEKIVMETEMELYGDFSISRPYDYENTENGIEITSTESVTKRWLSTNRRLNTLQFENEIFVPVKKEDSYILINSSNGKTVRSFYDSDFMLQRKEYWNIKSVIDSTLTKSEEYFYDAETKSISKKSESTENSEIITMYNSQKLPARIDVYIIDGENKYLQNRTLWRYTEDGKINIEESTTFFYEADNYKQYSDKITKRQTYIYKTDADIPPDYKYYENGILKMKTIYQDNASYVTQVYFDGGYSVQTFYENNVRVKDVHLLNDVVRRVKDYE